MKFLTTFVKKIIAIRSSQFYLFSGTRANTIENKTFAFQYLLSKMIVYDSMKNEWSDETCEVTKNLFRFTTVKVTSLSGACFDWFPVSCEPLKKWNKLNKKAVKFGFILK